MPVSQHPALQFGRSSPRRRCASRTAWPWGWSSLPCHPFPCGRFSRPPWSGVTPTSTMVAASPWASRPVGDPVIPSMIDVLAHCRCPVWALSDLIGRGLSYGGYRGQPSNSRHKTATGYRRYTVGAAKALLGRGVRAIQRSPWCAGLAEPPILQRLRTISASCTGSASPFPFGFGLVQWPRNIPPSFSTLRVGSIMSLNGASGSRKDWCHRQGPLAGKALRSLSHDQLCADVPRSSLRLPWWNGANADSRR